MAPRSAAASHPTTRKAGAGRTSTKKKGARSEREPSTKGGALKQDELRSDWEGMAPKPEQPSDDVAAPGQVPEPQH